MGVITSIKKKKKRENNNTRNLDKEMTIRGKKSIVALIIYLAAGIESSEVTEGYRNPCYITNWRTMKRYYIKKGSFMYNKTYEFDFIPEINSTRVERRFTFQICRTSLEVPEITIRRNYSWSVYSQEPGGEGWQAGQIGQLYGNMTLDYTSEFEDPNFIQIIPTVVNKSVLERESGHAVYHNPDPNFSYFYLYTDELEERTLYFEDDTRRRIFYMVFGILVCSIGLLFRLKQRVFSKLYPIRWLISSLLLAWALNFYNQIVFPKNNTLTMAVMALLPLLMGFGVSFSRECSLVMIYLMFILSLFDVACYLSFVTGYYNYFYIGLLSWYIVRRGKKLKPLTNEKIQEWMICCIVSIESSVYFCSILHFNPLIGGLLEITEGVYLNELEALGYIAAFVALNFFISEFRLKIIKSKVDKGLDLDSEEVDFYLGVTDHGTIKASNDDDVEIMSV